MSMFYKIKRKLLRVRLQPIHVFCFHHVSETYDPLTMWEEDWVNTNVFKQWIMSLKKRGYTFISLLEAHEKLKQNKFRCKKYAVLTADDGFHSLINIVPWLIDQQIPITLFVNPKYILEDGIGENVQYRIKQTEGASISNKLYLNKEDVEAFSSQLITFAYHGYEHFDEWRIDEATFTKNLTQCVDTMQRGFSNVIPFYAHTYGHAKEEYDAILYGHGLTPVYVSGNDNYNDAFHIDRKLVSNDRLLKGLL